MELSQALQETGCAISVDGDCTTSVERLTDNDYLLMTRRGVCILQHQVLPLEQITKHPMYVDRKWTPATVHFVSTRRVDITWGMLGV